MSRPMAVQPSLWASPTVVPLPMNGSKTTSPSRETAWRKYSSTGDPCGTAEAMIAARKTEPSRWAHHLWMW